MTVPKLHVLGAIQSRLTKYLPKWHFSYVVLQLITVRYCKSHMPHSKNRTLYKNNFILMIKLAYSAKEIED